MDKNDSRPTKWLMPPIGEMEVTIHAEARAALVAAVSRARSSPLTSADQQELIERVRNALNGYCISKRGAVNLTEWRAYLPKLVRALNGLIETMADSKTPGRAFTNPCALPHLPIDATLYGEMMSFYQAGRLQEDVETVRGFNPYVNTKYSDQIKSSEYRNEWMDTVFPFDLPSRLQSAARAAEEVAASVRTRGRDPDMPSAQLSAWLSALWGKYADEPPRDTRDQDGNQIGDFADFVRAALSPLGMDVRPASDETIIRAGASKPHRL